MESGIFHAVVVQCRDKDSAALSGDYFPGVDSGFSAGERFQKFFRYPKSSSASHGGKRIWAGTLAESLGPIIVYEIWDGSFCLVHAFVSFRETASR